jgi:hypothetical protein
VLGRIGDEGHADAVVAAFVREWPNVASPAVRTDVKSGTPSRDGAGRWWIGGLALDQGPFKQAMESKHQLVRKLAEMAGWPPRTESRAGHAIALLGLITSSDPIRIR